MKIDLQNEFRAITRAQDEVLNRVDETLKILLDLFDAGAEVSKRMKKILDEIYPTYPEIARRLEFVEDFLDNFKEE